MALASRLSEDSSKKVLVLEAGGFARDANLGPLGAVAEVSKISQLMQIETDHIWLAAEHHQPPR